MYFQEAIDILYRHSKACSSQVVNDFQIIEIAQTKLALDYFRPLPRYFTQIRYLHSTKIMQQRRLRMKATLRAISGVFRAYCSSESRILHHWGYRLPTDRRCCLKQIFRHLSKGLDGKWKKNHRVDRTCQVGLGQGSMDILLGILIYIGEERANDSTRILHPYTSRQILDL